MLPIGHTGEINNAQFSPDGKSIVTSSNDYSAKLWGVQTGNLIADLKGHTFFVNVAQFSPDGKQILTASGDGTVILWNTQTGDSVRTINLGTYGVNFAGYSPDGKKIVIASTDMSVALWDIQGDSILYQIKAHEGAVKTARFSSDGKKIVTSSYDKTAKIWDAITGKLISELPHHDYVNDAIFDPSSKKVLTRELRHDTVFVWDANTGKKIAALAHSAYTMSAVFSPDGTSVVTTSADQMARVWEAKSGKLVKELKGHSNIVYSAMYSPDGKKIVTTSTNEIAIWSSLSGKLLKSFNLESMVNATYSTFSPDGKKILIICDDNTVKVVDVITDKFVSDLSGYTYSILDAGFSPDGKKIVTASEDNFAYVWDISSGKILMPLSGHTYSLKSASFSTDGRKIVTCSWDMSVRVWDADSGKLIKKYPHRNLLNSACFSPDGKKIASISNDSAIYIWSTETDSILISINEKNMNHRSISFSPDGKKIMTTAKFTESVKIWDVGTGGLLLHLNKKYPGTAAAAFSPDGKKMAATAGSLSGMIRILDAETGELLDSISGLPSSINIIKFSPDGEKIITDSWENSIHIIEKSTGKILHELKGHRNDITSLSVSTDGKHILSSSKDNTCKLWDMETGRLLYTFFSLNGVDHLTIDASNRYDGSEAARKLLYFTCGTEVISLDQVKDQLWVPNLAERILKGETINAKTLDQLNICGLTPEVDDASIENEYRFKILPRKGGLGETILYVNGIELKRYKPQQLKTATGSYELRVKKQELKKYFSADEENNVSIKALTEDNNISSRSVVIDEAADSANKTPPNLYAIVIGVSDYKGDGLDLHYAAKDAHDFANAIELASKKLLNTDTVQHVFVHRIHTGEHRERFPEKNSIRQVFAEIGKKAKPNDVLLVFFAGHGKMNDKTKQFHFLTADASSNSISEALADVSISSEELFEWMKPDNINVKKRVLIFDACHSGQLNKDMIKVGNEGQGYVVARSDERSEQAKAIDKMNEKSGLFILSASASDQRAYEMSKYEQGVLTYSLLQAIKQQPEILNEQKYLDVSRWFSAAEKTVSELVKETSSSQQAQIVTTTNFDIGVVDDEVRQKIILPREKPLFTFSEFRNTRLRVDNLQLRTLMDKQLSTVSEKGSQAAILFRPGYNGSDAYSISGDYTVEGNAITASVLLIRGGTEIRSQFDIKGQADKLDDLVTAIITTVMEHLKGNK